MKLGALEKGSTGPEAHPMRGVLLEAVAEGARLAPRSLQKRIGPSEVGEPCARQLAYKMLEQPKVNFPDPWASIVGTACHLWMANTLLDQNTRRGQFLWLVEHRVEMRTGLDGSTDAYHVPSANVIDHKFVGGTKLKEYRSNGPGPKYRVQGHLYGLGWENLGLPVNDVVIAFYPRTSHEIRGLHVWAEPYNRQIAMDALERMDTILAITVELECDDYPENYNLIPKTPTDGCLYCPWFRPGQDTGSTCAGNKEF